MVFDFLFLLRLRHASKTSSLIDMIKKQHCYLEDVPDKKIKAILGGSTNHKVALLLDGYDEYEKGRNAEIDKVIDAPKVNTFVILTSRPGYVEKAMKNEMDGEVVIEGFSAESIQNCATKYLSSEDKCDEMLKQAEQAGLYSGWSSDLLRVPIILLMVCVIFDEKRSLPKSRTAIVKDIFELTIDRTTLKRFSPGMYADVKEFQDALLFALGELAWESLKKKEKELLLNKVTILNIYNTKRLFHSNK